MLKVIFNHKMVTTMHGSRGGLIFLVDERSKDPNTTTSGLSMAVAGGPIMAQD